MVYIFLGAYIDSVNSKVSLFLFSILGLASNIITCICSCLLPNMKNVFWDYQSILVCLCATGVFSLIKLISLFCANSNYIHNGVYKIAECCFGIYLIHDFLLMLTTSKPRINPYFDALFFAIISWIISLLIVFLLTKNKKTKKLLF